MVHGSDSRESRGAVGLSGEDLYLAVMAGSWESIGSRWHVGIAHVVSVPRLTVRRSDGFM